MKRFYVYRSPNPDQPSTSDNPNYEIVGYVEANCESNPLSMFPGAKELAQQLWGPKAEVVDSRYRKCNLSFVRVTDCIFVRKGLMGS